MPAQLHALLLTIQLQEAPKYASLAVFLAKFVELLLQLVELAMLATF